MKTIRDVVAGWRRGCGMTQDAADCLTCTAAAMKAVAVLSDGQVEDDRVVAFLLRAVESYLEKPGCNGPAKETAMGKLRWAAEETNRRIAGGL